MSIERLARRRGEPLRQDFPGRGLRERVEDGEATRVFERGEAILAVSDQLLGRGLRAGAKGHEGRHVLAELAVWHADDGGLGDGRVREQDSFHLRREDRVAAAEDALALAAEDRKSTRLNSSHMSISYAVFCLKKKKIIVIVTTE